MPSPVYHLRPNKFVSRRLFAEVLRYVDRRFPFGNTAYVGMGGHSLEDHKLIFSTFGITRMLSFDSEEATVKRQMFNRPLDSVVCLHRSSTDLIASLDLELSPLFQSPTYQQVVWLDFTGVRTIPQQLGDVQAILSEMRDGDVLRVTMNAHAPSLVHGTRCSAEDLLPERRRKFEELATHYIDGRATDSDFAPDTYPRQVLIAIRNAAAAAGLHTSGRQLVPIQVESYADGQTMVSATGVVLPVGEVGEFSTLTGLGDWPFYVSNWETPTIIDVPDLTIRERLLFDQLISGGLKGRRLGKDFPFQRREAMELLERYQRFSRYLPQFVHAVY